MHKLILLFSLLVFSACDKVESEGDNIENEEQLFQKLGESGIIPKLDELDRTDTIEGIDANGDGIRDDIERWIEKKYPLQIPEARQLARAFQRNLTTDTSNMSEVKKTDLQMAKALRCLIIIKGDKQPNFVSTRKIFDELSSITKNTKKRLLKNLEMSRALSGHVLSSYQGEDACE